jgi:uncharacterized repeat protein (TIGR03803 family)
MRETIETSVSRLTWKFALSSFVIGVLVLACFSLSAKAQTETVLYSFTGGADGGQPYGQLIRDHQGNLFGTTIYGGLTSCYQGCGTVFKWDNSGQESVLYSFTGASDGMYPYGGLVQDPQGTFYGTTTFGGAFFSGTAFQLSPSGSETSLHTLLAL